MVKWPAMSPITGKPVRALRGGEIMVRLAITLAIILPALFCVCGCPQTVSPTSDIAQVAQESNDPGAVHLRDLARSGHIEFLEHCLKNYRERYKDYRCTVTKQERIDGRVWAEQEIAVKFRQSPFSVSMEWVRNTDLSNRVLYVEGKFGNQMIVQPIAFLRPFWGQTFFRDPNAEDVRQRTLRTVDQFGFERGLTALLEVYRLARRNGDLKEEFGGHADVAGRKCVVLVRYLPAKDDYPAAKTVICIDTEYLLPISVEGYDWENRCTSRYIFKDLKFNVGLKDRDFTPEANDMKRPK